MRQPLNTILFHGCSLLATFIAAFAMLGQSAAMADGSTIPPVRAWSSPSLISSPALSPMAGQTSGSQPFLIGNSTSPILLPLHFSQGGGTSLAGANGTQRGVSFLYYTPGTGTDLAGNALNTTAPSTYGFTNNLTSGNLANSLQFHGQMYLSSGSLASGANALSGSQKQAFNQSVAYKSGAFSFSGSMLQVDRNFTGDDAVRTALTGTDPSSLSDVNALLTKKGQTLQNFAMGYAAAPNTTFGLTYNSAHDAIANKTTTDQLLSMATGTVQHGKLAMMIEDKTDSQSLLKSHSLSIGLDRQLASNVTLSALRTTVDMSGPSNMTQNTNKLRIVLQPNRYGPSLDASTIMQSDTLNGHDEQIALNVGHTIRGFNLGANYATDNQLADGSLVEAHMRTVGYQIAGNLSSKVSVSTNWKSVSNSALAGAQAKLDTQNTTFSYAASNALLISNSFTNSNNIANGKLGATYSLPGNFGMTSPKVGAFLLSQTGSATTATSGTGLSFDATLPAKNKLMAMLGDTYLHMEQNSSRATGIAGGVAPYSTGMRIVRVASAPTVHRQFLWSYLMMAPYSSASQQAALRCLDLSVAVGHGYTIAYKDSDQLQQNNAPQYTNAKLRKLSLAGPVPHSKLKFTTDLSRSLTYSNSDKHHAAASFTLSSPTAVNQLLALTLLRQFDELDTAGSDQSATYKLTYQLNVDPQTKFLVDGLVTTNQYQNRPDLRDNTNATVKVNYTRAF